MKTPEIDPRTAKAVIAKYPATTLAGLKSMWASAHANIEDSIDPSLPRPDATVIESAAMLYVMAIHESDPVKKQGMRYSACEMVRLYQRR